MEQTKDTDPNAAPTEFVSMLSPVAHAIANSTHSNNVYNATNLSFTTTVNTIASNFVAVSDWFLDLASVNQYAIQKETFEKVAPGTCQWILEEPSFDGWVTQGAGTFWGVGIPGAGKTILASFVIHHLQERAKSLKERANVVHVYCRHNDHLSVSNILASLLQQLFNNLEPAQRRACDDLYTRCQREKTKPSQTELERTLHSILSGLPRTFLVIDGLDELQESVLEAAMNILLSLGQSLFTTSRGIDLPHLTSPDLRLQAPKRDFETFIVREIERLPKLRRLLKDRKDVQAEVVDGIQSMSDGMFLLSALQLAALGDVTTIKSLRMSIRELPKSLREMYEMTLLRINSQSVEERSLALRAILWTTHSIRPLKSAELLSALTVDYESAELDPDGIADEKTLLSVCCGLLTINKETGARLIHYTAYDFFEAYRNEPFDDPHTFTSVICAVYRGCTDIDSEEQLEKDSLQAIAEETYPFIAYVVMNIGEHTYRSSLLHGGEIHPLVHRFLSRPRFFLPSYSSFMERPLDRCGVAHFSARYGILRWFEQSSNPSAFNQRSEEMMTPLLYACIGGHAPVVEFLLKSGKVDIEATDKTRLENAVAVAAFNRDHKLTELLLDHGASILPMVKLACQYGRVENTQHLLSHPSIRIGARNSSGSGAISCAIAYGRIDMVKRLLGFHSARDLNSPTEGFEPLELAFKMRNSTAASLLLGVAGVDYNARHADRSTAIHHAVSDGMDDIVSILLKNPDLNINARDLEGRTALHDACYGNAKSLHSLLRHTRIDAKIKDNRGWTPLHHASYYGSPACVRILLDCGLDLDIDAKTRADYWGVAEDEATALDIAIRKGATEVATLLEIAGARRSADLVGTEAWSKLSMLVRGILQLPLLP